jgi:hypothetical protein
MKRTSAKDKRERKLKLRLDLVRTTVRVLTPTELENVNGGTSLQDVDQDWSRCLPITW